MKPQKTRKTSGWPDDPVVEEVRKIRAQIWKEAGGTPEGLIRLLNKRQPRKKRAVSTRSKRRPSA